MSEDAALAEKKHHEFVQQIVANDKVWGLNAKEGWVISVSDEEDELAVMPFWSDEASAKKLIKDEWKAYKTDSLELSAFLEDWIGGMYDDGVMAGTNWDEELFGIEINPLELALEVIEEIKKQGKSVTFVNYEDLDDYESNIRDVIALEQEDDGEEEPHYNA